MISQPQASAPDRQERNSRLGAALREWILFAEPWPLTLFAILTFALLLIAAGI